MPPPLRPEANEDSADTSTFVNGARQIALAGLFAGNTRRAWWHPSIEARSRWHSATKLAAVAGWARIRGTIARHRLDRGVGARVRLSNFLYCLSELVFRAPIEFPLVPWLSALSVFGILLPACHSPNTCSGKGTA